jgi:hypothetical protein
VNQHPFSVGQKVLCVFADFDAEVGEVFDRVPEENCAYTVSEVYWERNYATGQTVASVKFLEITTRPYRNGGFSAWKFRLLEEGVGSHASSSRGGAAAIAPDEPGAAISQAADPTTEPALLALLFRDGPPSLGWMLAANPNTPDVVLHKLWKIHPLAVLENPLLAYQTLSNGRQLCQLLPLEVKLALYAALRNDGRMEEMEIHLPLKERWEWGRQWGGYQAVGDPEILAVVARLLVKDPAPAVRETMAHYLGLFYLLPLAGDQEVSVRTAVAGRAGRAKEGGEALIDILAIDPEEAVRLELAGSSFLTAATHERLAADPSAAVRQRLARQHQDREDIMETGWRSLVAGGSSLCLVVAQNRSCHESVRLELTAHANSAVRLSAWNRFHFVRSQLADRLEQQLDVTFRDPEQENERLVIARSSTLSLPVIERLLACSEQVTRALAANPLLPERALLLLLRHRDEETAVITIARVDGNSTTLIDEGFSHPSSRVRAVVAGISGRRAAQLRPKLAMDPSLPVRFSVCSYLTNKISGHDGPMIRKALEILSRDPVNGIRALVVQDRRLPQKDVSDLLGDKSVRVRLLLLKRRCYGTRKDLGLLDHKEVGVRVEAAKLIMENQRGRVKRSEHAYPSLDARIAADASPLVRVVAAESRNTSLPVLKLLIADEAPEVQRALTGRPTFSSERPGYAMSALEASPNPYERAMATGIYGAGKRRLQRLAADRCWYVRAMTARCGHEVGIELLETLAEDPHPLVQQCARGRLVQLGAALARPAEGGRP